MNQEEIAQLHSYLTSQARKRTPIQLCDALQETYRQFLEIVNSFPEATFTKPVRERIWSGAEIVEHVTRFMASYKQAICMVLEQGVQPPDVTDRSEILPRQAQTSRVELLASLNNSMQHLLQVVHKTGPDAYLDITWKHFELGAMHWREWLLFARVHLLDHVRQLQEMHN